MSENQKRIHNRLMSAEKVMTVYFILEKKKKMSYQEFYELFGATSRSFRRVLTTIKKGLEQAGIEGVQIVYNKSTKKYELKKERPKAKKQEPN